MVVERHHAVAVGALADALRRRRLQLGAGMPTPLGQVASREESDRAKQRDRDRGAVVERRVFAQPVDANGEAARRAGDRNHVVEAGVGGRGLDPLATYRKPVLTLEDREGRRRKTEKSLAHLRGK